MPNDDVHQEKGKRCDRTGTRDDVSSQSSLCKFDRVSSRSDSLRILSKLIGSNGKVRKAELRWCLTRAL